MYYSWLLILAVFLSCLLDGLQKVRHEDLKKVGTHRVELGLLDIDLGWWVSFWAGYPLTLHTCAWFTNKCCMFHYLTKWYRMWSFLDQRLSMVAINVLPKFKKYKCREITRTRQKEGFRRTSVLFFLWWLRGFMFYVFPETGKSKGFLINPSVAKQLVKTYDPSIKST